MPRYLCLLLILLSIRAFAADDQTPVEKCARQITGVDGKITVILDTRVHVAALATDEKFVLPADAIGKTTAIECGRTSIVPSANDYKVLQAGFILYIVADDEKGNSRVAVLEIVDGHLQLKSIEGSFSAAESEAINQRLNQLQPFFQLHAPASLTAHAAK